MAILFPQINVTASARCEPGAGLRFHWRKWKFVARCNASPSEGAFSPQRISLRESGRINAKLQTEKFTNRFARGRKAKRRRELRSEKFAKDS